MSNGKLMKSKVFYSLIFIVFVVLAFKAFEYKRPFLNINEYCEDKSIKPTDKFEHENINIAGYWFQFPEGRTDKYLVSDSKLECYEKVYFGFSANEITNIDMPKNIALNVYVAKKNSGNVIVPPNIVGDYDSEYDLTFFKQEHTTYLNGSIKLDDELPKEVVFYCYEDPREHLYPTCTTAFQLNQDLTVKIRMSTEHLKYWREIYLYIHQYFTNSII